MNTKKVTPKSAPKVVAEKMLSVCPACGVEWPYAAGTFSAGAGRGGVERTAAIECQNCGEPVKAIK